MGIFHLKCWVLFPPQGHVEQHRVVESIVETQRALPLGYIPNEDMLGSFWRLRCGLKAFSSYWERSENGTFEKRRARSIVQMVSAHLGFAL